MTRVAFLLNFPLEYKGGVNYLKNLLLAVSMADKQKLEIFLFVPETINEDLASTFRQYAEVVKTPLLTKGKLSWYVDKILDRYCIYSPLTIKLLKQYNISLVSHSNFCSRFHSFSVMNWIPDFQWLHYPDLWSKKDLRRTWRFNKRIASYSDTVVLSSFDALKDFKSFAKNNSAGAEVLQFVSQPDSRLFTTNAEEYKNVIEKKYSFSGKFFYLPNQFWIHKNHLVVFKALKILRQEGLNPLLLTTGLMKDYRNGNEHIEQLKKYVDDNGLTGNIRFLGLIPYEEVLFLMKNCLALINPSLFEGWSSTVEEAKSIGKKIILSNIAVHKEQNPDNAIYFDPNDEHELARHIQDLWESDFKTSSYEESAKNNLKHRTEKFGRRYLEIVAQTLEKKNAGGKINN